MNLRTLEVDLTKEEYEALLQLLDSQEAWALFAYTDKIIKKLLHRLETEDGSEGKIRGQLFRCRKFENLRGELLAAKRASAA